MHNPLIQLINSQNRVISESKARPAFGGDRHERNIKS